MKPQIARPRHRPSRIQRYQRFLRPSVIAVVASVTACASNGAPTTGPSGSGGSAGSVVNVGTAGATGGQGAVTIVGGSPSGVSGAGASSALGGLGGTGDSTLSNAGSGGEIADAGNGAAGGPAAGGVSGSSNSQGNGGSVAGDDSAAAQVLNGYAILKPCVSTFKPTPNANGDCCCEELAANENQHKTEKFGGEPNVTYNVKVRIAGIAERYWYTGGTLDATSKLFYTGGLPTIHSTQAPNSNLAPGKGACKIHPPDTDKTMALPFKVPVEVNPSDGCFNGFNIFAMTVSEPKQSYYLNYTTDYDGVDRQPHKVYKNDYTVTIPIQGGASLDFYTIDGDHHEVTNDGTMTVPNVKTMQPYNGNFLEFTVLSVTRAN